MKELIYAEIDFPEIPEDILDINFSYNFSSNTKYPGKGLQLIKDNGSLAPCKYIIGMTNSLLDEWLDNNLSWAKNLSKKIQIAEAIDSVNATHAVHSDINRSWALNYMIELGGNNAWTSWYKEKEKPLYRFRDRDIFQSDNGFVRYENLDSICSVKLKKFKWYLIRVDIMHDVHQIKNRRSSLTISIKDKNLPIELSKKILNPIYYEE
jgi:hypothetical protein